MTAPRDAVAEILHRPGSDEYESRFGSWESRSSVRTKPRRMPQHADTEDQVFFPPEGLPVLAHPLVAACGPGVRGRMLIHALYQYLNFTTVLEQATVLPVTAQISSGLGGVRLPGAMRCDAFKITTDEAWHAQFCYDFLQEVGRVTGVPPSAVGEPSFVGQLAMMRAAIEPSFRSLVDLFFAIVSETLVSGLLAEIPNDKRLPVPVRAIVGDHAEDEGRHHAYFRSLLRILWPRLSARERRLIGPLVPGFARIFLEPDKDSAIRILSATGFSAQQARDIVAESYPHDGRGSYLTGAAHWTVRAFTEVGALGDQVIQDAFASAGLIDSAV